MGPPAGPYAAGLLVPQWLLLCASLVVILLRLNLRLRVQRTTLTVSDCFMCAAWLSAAVTASFDIVFARMGALDPKIDYLFLQYQGPPEDIEFILKLLWISQFPFFLTFNLAKAALLSIYLRLFPIFMVKRRLLVWAVTIYCAAAFVATIFLTILNCLPIQSNWAVLNPEEACDINRIVNGFIVSWSLHFAGDIMIFLIPFMVMTQLQLRPALKAGLICTFLLGLINIAFTLTRFLTFQQASAANSHPGFSLVELWSALDVNITVLIACLPSLRPYFRGSIWKGHVHTFTSGKLAFSSKSHTNTNKSNKSNGNRDKGNEGVLPNALEAYDAQLADLEAARPLPDGKPLYETHMHGGPGPQGPGGRLAVRHKMSKEDQSRGNSPDDTSGRVSAVESDIELVMQKP